MVVVDVDLTIHLVLLAAAADCQSGCTTVVLSYVVQSDFQLSAIKLCFVEEV